MILPNTNRRLETDSVRCHLCGDPAEGMAACTSCKLPTCPECMGSNPVPTKCIGCGAVPDVRRPVANMLELLLKSGLVRRGVAL